MNEYMSKLLALGLISSTGFLNLNRPNLENWNQDSNRTDALKAKDFLAMSSVAASGMVSDVRELSINDRLEMYSEAYPMKVIYFPQEKDPRFKA